MKRVKDNEFYVNPKELREFCILYNDMNVADTGDWCNAYLQKMQTKKKKGKITEDDLCVYREFIFKKTKHINELRDEYYNKYSKGERQAFDEEFQKVKTHFYEMITKIVSKRINSYEVRTHYPEYVGDIIQNGIMAVIRYCNRFNPDKISKKTGKPVSCFCYLTELANNSIVFDLEEIDKNRYTFVSGLDYFENLNTIDDFRGEDRINDMD